MQESEATKTPWRIVYGNVSDADEGFGIAGTLEGNHHIVAECWPCSADAARRRQLRADAQLIVTAVNSHAALLAVAEAAKDYRSKWRNAKERWDEYVTANATADAFQKFTEVHDAAKEAEANLDNALAALTALRKQ